MKESVLFFIKFIPVSHTVAPPSFSPKKHYAFDGSIFLCMFYFVLICLFRVIVSVLKCIKKYIQNLF